MGYRDGIATIQNLGDMIIVQTRRGAVIALDPATGAARWHTAVGLAFPIVHRVGYNDTLILVANGTRIFALDRATGKELWDVDLPGSPSSPPTADTEAFYVCLANGRLSAYAFPIETAPVPSPPGTGTGRAGRPQEPAAPLSSGPAAASGSGAVRTQPVPARPSAGGNTPAAAAGPPPAPAASTGRTATVSAATSGRSVTTAVQASGGRTAVGGSDVNRAGHGPAAAGGPRLLWDYQTNLRILERPVFGDKTVFVIGTGRQAVFIDKATGTRPLDVTADAAFSAPLGQFGEIVYAACVDGSVYAFDLVNRVTLWRVTAHGPVTERPVPTDEDLFVTAEQGGVGRFVRATGEMLWQNPAAVRFVASNPKFVYAFDGTGRLLVLDRIRGTTLTALDARDFTVAYSNAVTDRLILGANDGTLVSLHDRAYAQPVRLRNPLAPPAPAAATPPPPAGEAPKPPDRPRPEAPAEPGASPPAPAKPAAPRSGNRPAGGTPQTPAAPTQPPAPPPPG
ncbi:MAG TPA: PQQ-binding-like beta-propeller repeat protein [Gemmataceae bacterium]